MEIEFQNFESDIIKPSYEQPVVVDFWASWCAPCKLLSPVLEKLADEADRNWILVKLNLEQHPSLAARFRVQSIPAVKMFHKGKVIAEFLGALPEDAVRKWLDDHIPSEDKLLYHEALSAIKDNQLEKAKKHLHRLLKINPHHKEARVTLARLVFLSDPEQALTFVDDIREGDKLADIADSIRTLAGLMKNPPNFITLKQENETLANLFNGGLVALTKGNLDATLNNWIEILYTDKHFSNDIVRTGCAALFNLLGSTHELTNKYHRSFTSALF
ncbi:tetratricopeptide repeat protein [candidate division KSB1 bacterium]|nr:tetratricopeptide repeat protein [candidate division KSB1 bacterium]